MEREIIIDKTFVSDQIIFGDGHTAIVWRRETKIDPEKGECWKLLLQLTKPLIQKHNIQPHELNPEGCIKKLIKKTDIIPMSQDPFAGRFELCLTDWNENPTPVLNLAKALYEKLKNSEISNHTLRMEIKKLQRELKLIKIRPDEVREKILQELRESKQITGNEIVPKDNDKGEYAPT